MKLDLQLTGCKDPIAQQNFWIFQKLFESGQFMTTKRLDFLLNQVEDPIAQENFWRIKKLFESGAFVTEASAAAVTEEETDICTTFLNVLSVEGSGILDLQDDECVVIRDTDEASVAHILTGSTLRIADV
jgi:hypothetical protein